MKISSGFRRRGRPCSARVCACGSPAIYVMQVQARTLGLGSRTNRLIQFGRPLSVCAQCACDVRTFTDQLGDSGSDAIKRITSDSPRRSIRKDALNLALPLS